MIHTTSRSHCVLLTSDGYDAPQINNTVTSKILHAEEGSTTPDQAIGLPAAESRGRVGRADSRAVAPFGYFARRDLFENWTCTSA
jgi:hypothetical protein